MRGSSYEAAEGAGCLKDAGRTRRNMGLIPDVHISELLQNLFCNGSGIVGRARMDVDVYVSLLCFFALPDSAVLSRCS